MMMVMDLLTFPPEMRKKGRGVVKMGLPKR
jgi:hypothetical protein